MMRIKRTASAITSSGPHVANRGHLLGREAGRHTQGSRNKDLSDVSCWVHMSHDEFSLSELTAQSYGGPYLIGCNFGRNDGRC